MALPEFDPDELLEKLETILKKKPKPPDPTTIALCEVLTALVVEVERVRKGAGAAR